MKFSGSSFVLLPVMAAMILFWPGLYIVTQMNFPFQTLIDAFSGAFYMALFSLVLHHILKRYRPATPTLILWAAILCVIWLPLSVITTRAIVDESYAYITAWETWPLRYGLAVLFTGSSALISGVYNEQRHLAKSSERIGELSHLAKDAELHSLRQQMQPHFLFNSLNSIHALTAIDPQKASEMVLVLSDYLRGTLGKEHRHMHSVADEIESSRLYLEIEKVRFGDRLQVAWEQEGDLSTMKVPSLILQPLVENAVKHGLRQVQGDVCVQISVRVNPASVWFCVANPYSNEVVQSPKGGFGLKALKRRLYLLYGRDDLLNINTNKEKFTVEMLIPSS